MLGIFIIFFYLFAVILYLKKSNANGILNASKWVIIVYLFLVVVYTFSGIHYHDNLSFYAITFMLINIIILLMSERCGYLALKKNILCEKSISFSLPRKIQVIGILCIIGTCCYIADIIRLNEVSFGLRIVDYEISWLGKIGFVFLCLGLFVWLHSLYIAMEAQKYPCLLGFLCLFSYISKDVIQAARGHVITISIATLLVFLYAKKKTKMKISSSLGIFIFLFFILGSFVFGYTYLISTTREVIADNIDKVSFSESWFGAQIGSETQEALDKLGPFRKPMSDLLFYYSHEFINYSIHFEYYNYTPTMGLNTFSYVTRRFEGILGSVSDDIEKQIEQTFTKANMSLHSWGTYQKTLLIDYGKIGTVIASIILGFLMGLSRKNVVFASTPTNVVLQTLICTGAVLSMHGLPFAEAGWAYPLFLAIFLKIRLPDISHVVMLLSGRSVPPYKNHE
jgi:hypothetical protein